MRQLIKLKNHTGIDFSECWTGSVNAQGLAFDKTVVIMQNGISATLKTSHDTLNWKFRRL